MSRVSRNLVFLEVINFQKTIRPICAHFMFWCTEALLSLTDDFPPKSGQIVNMNDFFIVLSYTSNTVNEKVRKVDGRADVYISRGLLNRSHG